jgi:ankyrin repeat protein
MAAADKGHNTIVQVLLDAKADASLQSMSGYTALTWAEHRKQTATAQVLRQHAKRLTAEAEAKAASAATDLLAEEAAEKEAAAIKKGKGKKKKAKAAPSTAEDDLAEADALASTTRPAVTEEGLPEGVGLAARLGDERAVAACGWTRAAAWTQAAQSEAA